MRMPNLVLLTPPGSWSRRFSVGSRLRDRCGETDSFTALAPFARSITQSSSRGSAPTFISWLLLQCPDWFWFLKRVRECMDVFANAPRASREEGENEEAQPDHCTETESRRDLKRTEGLWEWWCSRSQESTASELALPFLCSSHCSTKNQHAVALFCT